MPTTTTTKSALETPVSLRLGVCPCCAGYGRVPSGCVDYQTGDDRGLHCEHCDGRGEVEVDAFGAAADETETTTARAA